MCTTCIASNVNAKLDKANLMLAPDFASVCLLARDVQISMLLRQKQASNKITFVLICLSANVILTTA